MSDPEHPEPVETTEGETRHSDLPPAAQRALAEAEERRRRTAASQMPVEVGGRNGPEPVRFGDWERKGIAVDF